MEYDELIRLDIMEALKDMLGDDFAATITVSVKEGVVTLGGEVSTYAMEKSVRDIVESVPGVRAIVQDTEVKLSDSFIREDGQIAQSIISALDRNKSVPPGRVKATVKGGMVFLEGDVDQYSQKREAETTIQHIAAVRGIVNNIKVTIPASPTEIKGRIVDYWKLMVEHHSSHLQVACRENKVILSGTIYAWIEKAEAEKAVREMLGNVEIENNLELTPLLKGKEEPDKALETVPGMLT